MDTAAYRRDYSGQVARVFMDHPELDDHRSSYPWLLGALGDPTAPVWFMAENPSLTQVSLAGQARTPEAQWSQSRGDSGWRCSAHRGERGPSTPSVPSDPSTYPGGPELQEVPKPIVSAEDIYRLADAIDPHYRLTILLGALGLRQAEVFGLRVGAIDFLRRTLSVRSTVNEIEGRIVEGIGKTAKSVRTFSVPPAILDELAAHLARTGRTDPAELVIQAPDGGPVRATNFRYRVYDKALREAGLEGLTFHRLRHSAGHIMREAGVPLEVIQRRLGHASIRTTADIYGSLPEKVDRAVAAQLDELFRAARGGGDARPDAGAQA